MRPPLEQEENKVLRSQLELTQVQQKIALRIAEKEEEFMLVKKNFSKALEGMHLALETESKAKAEALRMKKKLEGDVGDLDIALDHANARARSRSRQLRSGTRRSTWRRSRARSLSPGTPLLLPRGWLVLPGTLMRKPGGTFELFLI